MGAASAQGGFIAVATDLTAHAERMLAVGLAKQTRSIVLAPPLAGIASIANSATLRHIARVLLTYDEPSWLRLAVSPHRVSREYIPTNVLRDLEWLDPELDDILLDVVRSVSPSRESEFAKRIGDAAEAVILAALRADGRNPTHVAPISDTFGYDIECSGPPVLRVEVKGCSVNTRGTFHLSRNEYNKSVVYGDEWILTQVVFKSEAFVASVLKPAHIAGVFEVSARDVASVVPSDTTEFVWTESAVITPLPTAWRPVSFSLADVTMPGLAR
ncbi:protein NO VEIN domain-containing protein [Micromonospora sp. RB23]